MLAMYPIHHSALSGGIFALVGRFEILGGHPSGPLGWVSGRLGEQ